MTALFVSDLHLSDQRPDTTRAFLSFLDGPARATRDLYILGDLFEYWVGDDDASILSRTVSDAMVELVRAGIGTFFVAGNRDFLLGERYAASCGMRILPDPALIEIGGNRVLLSHGDILCTDDLAYQDYRARVRDPAWRAAFLTRPLAERRRVAEELRRQSEQAKHEKAVEIMDVNPAAVDALFRDWAYPTLIHGHTHRPAHHHHVVDGHHCERWVLADWHDDAPYLEWNEGGAGPIPRRHRPAIDA
jgi:UDP-2,3-diacylglucosamine hydrolase